MEQETNMNRLCRETINLFIDNQKPNILIQRQLRDLHVYWEDLLSSPREDSDIITKTTISDDQENKTIDAYDEAAKTSRSSDNFTTKHQANNCIKCRLCLSNQHIVISIYAQCQWRFGYKSVTGNFIDVEYETKSHGDQTQLLEQVSIMHFSLYVKASQCIANCIIDSNLQTKRNTPANVVNGNDAIVTEEQTNRTTESPTKKKENSMMKKEERTRRIVRNDMTRRFKLDPYIRRLLHHDQSSSTTKSHTVNEENKDINLEKEDAEHGTLLCEAMVQISHHQQKQQLENLEERVYVSDDALEGTRRAIVSQMDSNIALMEFLLLFPYLPKRSNHTTNGIVESPRQQNEESEKSSNGEKRYTDKYDLARRIVLRILEDVMVEECEKEGNDEMLDDLNITTRGDDCTTDIRLKKGKRQKT